MTNQLKTIDLKGKQYAQVAERLRQFREDNPNGSIKTDPTIMDDGQIMFKTTILKDKSDENSADATGHALGKSGNDKAFEKLESISVGRALALLGYAASGEIASSEEMEEFNEYRTEKIEIAISKINDSETVDALKDTYMALGNLLSEAAVIEAKDKKKAELTADSEATDATS